MSSPKTTAVVIGAGFGGIAAALRLRARGYDVTLVDRLDQLGGRGVVHHRNGFVFDAGPTVITAPFLFEELFTLFDRNLADYLTIQGFLIKEGERYKLTEDSAIFLDRRSRGGAQLPGCRRLFRRPCAD